MQLPPSPPVGTPQRLEPGIRRILAPNPSPMTFWGTNTYVLGEGDVALLDPGPADRAHFHAILSGLDRGERIGTILVSHAHIDHSPLARALSEATGAPVLAYGAARDGMSEVMVDLVARGLSSGGEGIDRDFRPDQTLADGDRLDFGDWTLEVIRTPGHMSNHLCFAMGDAVFTADHVMGWASSLVSPPDGDLTAFMASCRRLEVRADRVYYPGHGAPVETPADRIRWLIDHRQGREAEILAGLSHEPATIPELTRRIYIDVDQRLLPAAARNVFAHLIDLTIRDMVRPRPRLDFTAKFERI